MRRRLLIAGLLLPALVLAQPEIGGHSDEAQFQQFLDSCRERYAEVDARIDAAGLRDAAYYRVPGFPYLRTDRLLSSYRGELDSLDRLGTWMLQLREYDSIARDYELENLGLSRYERGGLLNDLRVCAVWMSFADLGDEPRKAQLLAAAQVPDEPAAVTADAAARKAQREALLRRFSEPLSADAKLRLWTPAAVDDEGPLPDLGAVSRDELGRVGLLVSAWPKLARRFAPPLLMDAAARLGQPALDDDQGHARLDARTAVVHYLPGYARVGGRTYVQLSYFIWFATADGKSLDGLIWRVTLDDQSRPLLYDSLRMDGAEPAWFPVQPQRLGPRPPVEGLPTLPQAQLPEGRPVLRLAGGDHHLQRLVAVPSGVPTQAYQLQAYEDLSALPQPGGGSRGLFDPNGQVAGSAPRQWGHHALGAEGHRHFDDPRLIEALFQFAPEAGETLGPVAGR